MEWIVIHCLYIFLSCCYLRGTHQPLGKVSNELVTSTFLEITRRRAKSPLSLEPVNATEEKYAGSLKKESIGANFIFTADVITESMSVLHG